MSNLDRSDTYTRATYCFMVGSRDPRNALLKELIKVSSDNIPLITKPLEVAGEKQNQLKDAFEQAVGILGDVKNAPTPAEMSAEAVADRNTQIEELAAELKELGQAFKKEMSQLQSLEAKNESSIDHFNERVANCSAALREVVDTRIEKVKELIKNQGIDVAHPSFEKELHNLAYSGSLDNKSINAAIQKAMPGADKVDIKAILEATKPTVIVEATRPVLETQKKTQAELVAGIGRLSENRLALEQGFQAEINKLAKHSPRASQITLKSSPGMRGG